MEYTLGGLLAICCILLGYSLKRLTYETNEPSIELYCGYIETIHSNEEDPWDYTLEPCSEIASVIIGGNSRCEDHLAIYLQEMSGTLES